MKNNHLSFNLTWFILLLQQYRYSECNVFILLSNCIKILNWNDMMIRVLFASYVWCCKNLKREYKLSRQRKTMAVYSILMAAGWWCRVILVASSHFFHRVPLYMYNKKRWPITYRGCSCPFETPMHDVSAGNSIFGGDVSQTLILAA